MFNSGQTCSLCPVFSKFLQLPTMYRLIIRDEETQFWSNSAGTFHALPHHVPRGVAWISAPGLLRCPHAVASAFASNSNTTTTTTSNPSSFVRFSYQISKRLHPLLHVEHQGPKEIESYGLYIQGTCHILYLFRPEYQQRRSNS